MMKRIFVLLLFFCSYQVFAQNDPVKYSANGYTFTIIWDKEVSIDLDDSVIFRAYWQRSLRDELPPIFTDAEEIRNYRNNSGLDTITYQLYNVALLKAPGYRNVQLSMGFDSILLTAKDTSDTVTHYDMKPADNWARVTKQKMPDPNNYPRKFTIEFNRYTPFYFLYDVQKKYQEELEVSILYRELKFNNQGYLTYISLEAETAEGRSGSVKSDVTRSRAIINIDKKPGKPPILRFGTKPYAK